MTAFCVDPSNSMPTNSSTMTSMCARGRTSVFIHLDSLGWYNPVFPESPASVLERRIKKLCKEEAKYPHRTNIKLELRELRKQLKKELSK